MATANAITLCTQNFHYYCVAIIIIMIIIITYIISIFKILL